MLFLNRSLWKLVSTVLEKSVKYLCFQVHPIYWQCWWNCRVCWRSLTKTEGIKKDFVDELVQRWQRYQMQAPDGQGGVLKKEAIMGKYGLMFLMWILTLVRTKDTIWVAISVSIFCLFSSNSSSVVGLNEKINSFLFICFHVNNSNICMFIFWKFPKFWNQNVSGLFTSTQMFTQYLRCNCKISRC